MAVHAEKFLNYYINYIGITKMHPPSKRWGKNGSHYKGIRSFEK